MNWFANIDLSSLQTSLPTLGMVAWLAWHLNGKFFKIENDLKNLVATHELKDQLRHVENIERFAELTIGQARLGLLNGYHASPKEDRDTASS